MYVRTHFSTQAEWLLLLLYFGQFFFNINLHRFILSELKSFGRHSTSLTRQVLNSRSDSIKQQVNVIRQQTFNK